MEECIRVFGKIIKCMGMEYINGEMVDHIMVNIIMIKNKGRESIFGQMGKYLKENGKMEN